jgi:hypothetical protein
VTSEIEQWLGGVAELKSYKKRVDSGDPLADL